HSRQSRQPPLSELAPTRNKVIPHEPNPGRLTSHFTPASVGVGPRLLSSDRVTVLLGLLRVNAPDTAVESKPDLPLEIAHLLLIDVVGYSKLLVNEQIELLRELNQLVRGTECFRAAESSGKLIRLPTGDGMALLFFDSPEEPARCALEISKGLQNRPHIQL